ncbi:MAG: hypothetical protein QOD99_2361, partial [Chthoniobacter sp.]|nr:hypothetical protein [Chthoniobacter sp.]
MTRENMNLGHALIRGRYVNAIGQ